MDFRNTVKVLVSMQNRSNDRQTDGKTPESLFLIDAYAFHPDKLLPNFANKQSTKTPLFNIKYIKLLSYLNFVKVNHNIEKRNN